MGLTSASMAENGEPIRLATKTAEISKALFKRFLPKETLFMWTKLLQSKADVNRRRVIEHIFPKKPVFKRYYGHTDIRLTH